MLFSVKRAATNEDNLSIMEMVGEKKIFLECEQYYIILRVIIRVIG